MTVEQDLGLLDEFHAAGHEIATHGYGHRHLWRMSMEELGEDLNRAIGLLAGRLQRPILGYRAPQLSVPRDRTAAFFETLARAGLRYDSSVFPFHGRRYGLPEFSRRITTVDTPAGPIVEVPLSVRPVLGRPLPVAGGGYWRVLPGWSIAANIRWLNRRGLPMVAYVHSYEFDPQRLSSGWAGVSGRIRRLRLDLGQNLRRAATCSKVRRLLARFSFTSMERYLSLRGHLRAAEPPEGCT
jgi:hypothetical protein